MRFFELTLAMEAETKEEQQLFSQWDHNTDIIIYSGGIGFSLDKSLLSILRQREARPNLLFLLTTYGGDADAAYRAARFLQTQYKKFTLGVLGNCKSAGTIIAFAADEIIMSHSGEFGPLDVQLFRPDEFLQRTSGTTISQALSCLSSKAFESFEEIFLALRRRSGGIITTQTAADIASSLVGSLFSPITAKIDPMRIGEMQRSLDIAIHYAMRLGGDRNKVENLAKNYPCHSFVIDIQEARYIFNDVREPNDTETLILAKIASAIQQEFGKDYLAVPADDDFAAVIEIVDQIPDDKENNDADTSQNTTTQEC